MTTDDAYESNLQEIEQRAIMFENDEDLENLVYESEGFLSEDIYDEEEYETKSERRERKKEKKKYGMVKHNEPNVRPVSPSKKRPPKITFQE